MMLMVLALTCENNGGNPVQDSDWHAQKAVAAGQLLGTKQAR